MCNDHVFFVVYQFQWKKYIDAISPKCRIYASLDDVVIALDNGLWLVRQQAVV